MAVTRLVSSSPGAVRRLAVVPVGRSSGVRPTQPVRGPAGLIGRVIETGSISARILLLTDPASVVPVRRATDDLEGVVVGDGAGGLELRPLVSRRVQLRAGDLFVTSGVGGVFPPGIPVALVRPSGGGRIAMQALASVDLSDPVLVLPGVRAGDRGPTSVQQSRHGGRRRLAGRAMTSRVVVRRPAAGVARASGRAGVRWSPRLRSILMILLGSLSAVLPILADAPILPPLGFLAFVVWRLLAPDLFPPWSALGFGLFDDLVSGNPLGTAIFLWTVAALALPLANRAFPFRTWRQDWLMATGAVMLYLTSLWFLSPVNGGAPIPLFLLLVPAGVTAVVVPFVVRLATGPGEPDPRRT